MGISLILNTNKFVKMDPGIDDMKSTYKFWKLNNIEEYNIYGFNGTKSFIENQKLGLDQLFLLFATRSPPIN